MGQGAAWNRHLCVSPGPCAQPASPWGRSGYCRDGLWPSQRSGQTLPLVSGLGLRPMNE